MQNAVNAMMAAVCPHQITLMSCDVKKVIVDLTTHMQCNSYMCSFHIFRHFDVAQANVTFTQPSARIGSSRPASRWALFGMTSGASGDVRGLNTLFNKIRARQHARWPIVLAVPCLRSTKICTREISRHVALYFALYIIPTWSYTN